MNRVRVSLPGGEMSRSTALKIGGFTMFFLTALFALIPFQHVPPREQLVEVSGQLGWWEHSVGGKYGRPARFQLSGSERRYQYHAKEGQTQAVDAALSRASIDHVHILIDPGDDFDYVTAYQVRVGEVMARSYDDVVASYESDNEFGMWTIAVLIVSGTVLLLLGFRKPRA